MMTLLETLVSADPAVARMAKKYLLDEDVPYTQQGWIGDFLERFDPETGRWGGGIYGPKWISTFYTMRDLAALEIDPAHPVYQRGLDTLLRRLTTGISGGSVRAAMSRARWPTAGVRPA